MYTCLCTRFMMIISRIGKDFNKKKQSVHEILNTAYDSNDDDRSRPRLVRGPGRVIHPCSSRDGPPTVFTV